MLKSRGDGRSTSTTTPSALANRVPEQISSSSYSFNQLHPILPPPGAHPPRTPPHSIPPTSQPSHSTTVPKDAHFPKLPSAPSVAPRSSLSSSLLSAPTKWAAKNRLVTAAEVVASSPPHPKCISAEEEAAAKELESFALLVPVVSTTPRNPNRTVGHGGLRGTGSLVTLQQRRNAGSKLKHPHNNLYPPSSLLGKDSSSRLQSLTSQSKLQTIRKSASNSVSVSASGLSSVWARGKTSAPSIVNQVKLGEGRMNTLIGRKDSNETFPGLNTSSGTSSSAMSSRPASYRNPIVTNSTPNSITSKVHADEISTGVANISVSRDSSIPGKFHSRTVEHTQGIHVDASTGEEIEPRTEYRSESLSDTFSRRATASTRLKTREQAPKNTSFGSRNSGYPTFKSTQDVRISRDRPLSPNVMKRKTRVSEEDVLELRRQAFAPSTDSRTLRSRNSAYQSTRKSNPTLNRRSQTPSNLATNVANIGTELARSITTSQNNLDHRIRTHGRGRPVAFEHDRALSSFEDILHKSPPRLENNSGRTSVVTPKNVRADAIRTTQSANSNNTLARKGMNGVEESSCVDLSLAAESNWAKTTECNDERDTEKGIGLRFLQNRGVSSEVQVPFPSESSKHSGSSGLTINSSDGHPQGLGDSKYTSAWSHFDTNFSLDPSDAQKVPTPKGRCTSSDGPSCRVLKGYHEESHFVTSSSRVVGQDRGCGRFAKSPIFGGIGNGSDAWIPTIDGPHNEEISKLFLATEAEAAERRGGSRPMEGRRGVCCSDGKKKVGVSAIEQMIRIQSDARSQMPGAQAEAASNGTELANGKLVEGIWGLRPDSDAEFSAPNPREEFVLPPLPTPSDAGFDSHLKRYGGYPADEEVACDGPSQFQKRTYRHFNS